MLPVAIRSTGCYIPSVKVSSSDLDEQFGFEIGFVEKATGVRTRYYSGDEETAPAMGARAVEAALKSGGLSMADVDALISVSGSSAQAIPCTASLILEELGALDEGIPAFDLNSTCLGFIVGFDTASHLMSCGRYDRVVLVAAEAGAGSGALSPTEWESACLIGDAAVAVVLEKTSDGVAGVVGSQIATYPRGAHACEVRAGGTTRHPMGKRKVTEEDYYFRMDGPQVFRMAYTLMPGVIERLFSSTGESVSDFDLVVPHQASGPAVNIMSRRLKLPVEKVFVYLRDFGNTIAASIPLGIHFAIGEGRLRRGDKVLLAGTGAGLSIGALSFVY